jgi:hypothetical protein
LTLDVGTVNYGLSYILPFSLTAPSGTGHYIGYIGLSCKGFYVEDIPCEFNVT